MTETIFKFGMGRICLISFILLCSVFTSENAFSRPWDNSFVKVSYPDIYLQIDLLVHQYCNLGNNGYIGSLALSVSGDIDKNYTKLVTVSTKDQKGKNRVLILTHPDQKGENIRLLTLFGKKWLKLDDGKDLSFFAETTKKTDQNGAVDKVVYLTISWDRWNTYLRSFRYVKIEGVWFADNKSKGQEFVIINPYPH